MRIAILSDIHSNLLYFEECLRFIKTQDVDLIVSLGDNIGYFEYNRRLSQLFLEHKIVTLSGNHEFLLLNHRTCDSEKSKIYRIDETLSRFGDLEFDTFCYPLPFLEKEVDGLSILFVHGSPWDPINGRIYPDGDFSMFKHLPYDYVFMGHVHRPFMYEYGSKFVVNVGSCGLPRDQGNLASFCLFDTLSKQTDIIRIEFDIDYLLESCGVLDSAVINCLNRKINRHAIVGNIIRRR